VHSDTGETRTQHSPTGPTQPSPPTGQPCLFMGNTYTTHAIIETDNAGAGRSDMETVDSYSAEDPHAQQQQHFQAVLQTRISGAINVKSENE
jgi:hypothetical protein